MAEERYYEGVSHIGLIAGMAAPLHFLSPVLDDVAQFLKGDALPNSDAALRRDD